MAAGMPGINIVQQQNLEIQNTQKSCPFKRTDKYQDASRLASFFIEGSGPGGLELKRILGANANASAAALGAAAAPGAS